MPRHKECDACQVVLKHNGITSLSSFKKWSVANHPDKVGEAGTQLYQVVSNCVDLVYKNQECEEEELFAPPGWTSDDFKEREARMAASEKKRREEEIAKDKTRYSSQKEREEAITNLVDYFTQTGSGLSLSGKYTSPNWNMYEKITTQDMRDLIKMFWGHFSNPEILLELNRSELEEYITNYWSKRRNPDAEPEPLKPVRKQAPKAKVGLKTSKPKVDLKTPKTITRLEDATLPILREFAKSRGMVGISKMNKAELIHAIKVALNK